MNLMSHMLAVKTIALWQQLYWLIMWLSQ